MPTVWYNDGQGGYAAEFLPLLEGDTEGRAHDVNSAGQIVGYTRQSLFATDLHAVLWTYTPPPLAPTPEEEIQDLIQVIGESGLPDGIERSLVAKLEAALDALEGGDVASACASLSDFINHVNAKAGKKLSLAQADQFRTAATALREALGCS